MALLLVSMALMPVVTAQQIGNNQTGSAVGKVTIYTPPPIKIIENTHIHTLVNVGDIVINLTSNPAHTAATMTVWNTTSNEKHEINYQTILNGGNYTTQITVDGKPGKSFTTSYDPFEPGVTGEILKTSIASSKSVNPMVSNFYWDGIYFDSGSGIKYPHPDYAAYGTYAYQDFTLDGNQLYHTHIDNSNSASIAQLAPVAAGAVIGAYVGDVVGAAAGAIIGDLLSGPTSQALLDEQGSIWYWDSYNWGYVVVPVSPYLVDVPYYFRISDYTLWNGLGISDP